MSTVQSQFRRCCSYHNVYTSPEARAVSSVGNFAKAIREVTELLAGSEVRRHANSPPHRLSDTLAESVCVGGTVKTWSETRPLGKFVDTDGDRRLRAEIALRHSRWPTLFAAASSRYVTDRQTDGRTYCCWWRVWHCLTARQGIGEKVSCLSYRVYFAKILKYVCMYVCMYRVV